MNEAPFTRRAFFCISICSKKLEKAAFCLTPGGDDKATITAILNSLIQTHVATIEREPRISAVKDRLKAVSEKARELATAIDAADREGGVDLWSELDRLVVRFDGKFEPLIGLVPDFADAADIAVKKWSSQRPQSAHDLVNRLAALWQQQTGSKPTRNKNKANGENLTEFQKFIQLVQECLPEGEQFSVGIDRAIREVTRR
jgi:hypothetical protein